MTGNFTFSMIKPDVLQDGQVGQIITQIEDKYFEIKALKLTQLTLEHAEAFYAIHKKRPFYEQLCKYMASGPIIAMVLVKNNAVADFRTLLGATNPAEAAPETIRKRFGKSIEANAIHGSDSDETAWTETQLLFPGWSL
ncbi:MAG: nucleoside-diphosphate kinase [Bacteroidota bacterium]